MGGRGAPTQITDYIVCVELPMVVELKLHTDSEIVKIHEKHGTL